MLVKLNKALLLIKTRSELTEFKSFYRQLFEVCILLMMRRIGPGYYHLAEMGKKCYSWSFLFSFANAGEYHNNVLNVNSPFYQKLSQHKAIEKAILTTYGIPTSPLLGHLDPINGLDVFGRPLKSAHDLERLLANHVDEIICFKPVEGYGGAGFSACYVSQEHNGLSLVKIDTKNKFTINDFFQENQCSKGYVVECYVKQAAQMAKFHPESVNTVRVLVLRGADGVAKCLGMTFRIGQGGSIIDNATAGGIMVNVDIDTGVMSTGVFMEPSSIDFINHPSSDVALEGEVLPFHQEIKVLACKALDAFPHVNFAGFDVAVSEQGPLIIELNPKPDYVFMAINKLPSRYLFNQ